jgi:hypothetical protein
MPYLTTRPAFSLPALSMSLMPPPALAAPKPSAWSTHVRQVYADLKATDPGTTFKQALTHARASWLAGRA